METGSFMVYIKTEDIHVYTLKDAETRFDTLNYELDIPLPRGKNKKVIGLMKEKLGGKILKKFAALGANTYNFLTDNSNKDRNTKGTKKVYHKNKARFEDYKICLKATKLENRLNLPKKVI